MLKQRVITAFILMSVFLVLLFFSPWYSFGLFVALIFAFGAWEWSDLSGLVSFSHRVAYVTATVLFTAGAALWTDFARDLVNLRPILLVACVFWVLAFICVQSFPSSAVVWRSVTVRLAMGWLVLSPAWLATMYLRNQNNGVLLVLLCLLIVAAADVGAYFSGKRFGRRKLAPAVSPSKSWEGVWGGLVLALAVGIAFNAVFGHSSWQPLFLIVVPAALISVVGDLFESMIKRVRGIKDSGTILPGHGGILDRVDGMVAAAPLFALFVLVTGWAL